MLKKSFFSIFCFLLCCNLSMAQAISDDGLADLSDVDFIPLGFGNDDKTYWFGQYGLEDGDYIARLNILEMSTNRYIDNTPITHKLTGDLSSAYPFLAWQELMTQNAEFLKKDGILNPGILLWAMAPQQIGNGAIAEWRHNQRHHGEIRLEKFDVSPSPDDKDCKTRKLFKLYYHDKQQGFETLFYQDERLPKSRGCAVDYRLRAIYAPELSYPGTDIVVIISVYKDSTYLEREEGKSLPTKVVSHYIAVPFYLYPIKDYYKNSIWKR